MLTPTLKDPSDLLRKLERERYRAFHSKDSLHKADHLYNFCITGLAVRDFIFETLGWDEPRKNDFYKEWNKERSCVACAEIANTSKHCILRNRKTKSPRTPKTKAVTTSVSTVVEVYQDRVGSMNTIMKEDDPDFDVVLSDGTAVKVYEFTESVIRFFRQVFDRNGIAYKEQSFEELSGATT